MRTRNLILVYSLMVLVGCGGDSRDAGEVSVVITIPVGYRLGGLASGVPAGLTLTEATAGQVVVSHDGAFWFPTLVAPGKPYAVETSGPLPPGTYCSLASAIGVMPRADVSGIEVECRSVSPAGGE